MRTRVVVGKIPWKWTPDASVLAPQIKAYESCFLDIFAAYTPQLSTDRTGAYGFPAYEFEAPADDPQIKRLLGKFDEALKTATSPGAAFFIEIPTAKELDRVRFLEPYYFSNFVTEGTGVDPGLILCSECEQPNLSHRPDPLLVNKSVLKQYDIFHTDTSFLVVRNWVLELLKGTVGSQFDFGEVAIAKSKEKLTGDARLFWLRPKAFIGAKRLQTYEERTCASCQRKSRFPGGMIDHKIGKQGPGLFDDRCQVEHLGAPGLELAMIDESQDGFWPKIVVSGALLAFLKARGAKGMVALTKQLWPQCIFSASGEPTLQAEVRKFDESGKVTKATQVSERIKVKKQIAVPKDLPWDCTADGYVYFQLSTDKFVALDPMTAEESDSPYVVTQFKGPGIYRFPVSAIKRASRNGIAVDSATLLFVDNAYLSNLLDEYEWELAASKGGELDWTYHQSIAEKVGTRFGVCSVPPDKFKSAFRGDGCYRIEAKQVKLVENG